jgi:protein-S-isoprenylcysteine O-methyltransferase Ste14
MTMPSLVTLEYYFVFLGWFLFALLFLLQSRVPHVGTARRDRRSLIGMMLQGLGYAIVWGFRRDPTGPPGALEPLRFGLVVLLLVCSLLLTLSARRRLGKQWSLSARVLDEHDLITTGPYRLVRHPIYTGMLGMLLATGLGVGRMPTFLLGAATYVWGTLLRTRVEERLLRATFGERYDDYARRVPALLPRWPS